MNNDLSYEISHVVVTPRLMKLLNQRPKGRYSRSDAYFDLLGRAMVKKPFSVLPKTASAELLAEFDTTITDLAEKWSWQRSTVRDFLSELSAIGQIEREDSYKNMTITFDALKFDWKQQTVNATSVPSIQENGGDTSLNVAESPQEAAVGSSAKTSGNSVGKNGVHKETSLMVDAKESEMVSSQRKYCRVLFDEIFADMSELIRKWTYTPKVEHALYRAYYNVCGGNRERWQEYISRIPDDDTLSLTIYSNEAMHSSADRLESFFIRFGTCLNPSDKTVSDHE